ncbi:MAG: hypothetical protein IKU01_01655 [Bacteroidales bacterium]|nr:hypothetical protein [Bacteroidales bacterium]
MGVRNCQEIGENLQKIVSRLMANDDLVNLLYYTDKDPLSHPHLTEEQKRQEIFEKMIKINPRVGPKETANSMIVIRVARGNINLENNEFLDILIEIETFVPLTQWIIKNTNLRPFAIMGEVQKSLNGKVVNGLGKVVGGNFEMNFLSEEMSCYLQQFRLTTYD